MAGCSGESVWTSTSPGVAPRPERPAIWAMSWNVRSEARKSGMWRPESALRMPARVTLGKSRPLAIICVPMRMSILPARKRPRISSWLNLREVTSASMRWMLAVGKRRRAIVSTRWVPMPLYLYPGAPQSGQVSGTLRKAPQRWQRSRSSSRWKVMPTEQLSQRSAWPHLGQTTEGA